MDAFQGAGALGAAMATRPVNITVSLPQVPLMVPAAAMATINQLALATMKLALQHAAGEISERAPRDSGQLAQSFGADPAGPTGGIEILGADLAGGEVTGRVFSSLPYAIVMNDGRRPGQPISRAGIDAIGLWAERKLGLSSQEADRAKWGIAHHIVAQGIQGTGYADEGITAATPTIEGMFAALGESITSALGGN